MAIRSAEFTASTWTKVIEAQDKTVVSHVKHSCSTSMAGGAPDMHEEHTDRGEADRGGRAVGGPVGGRAGANGERQCEVHSLWKVNLEVGAGARS